MNRIIKNTIVASDTMSQYDNQAKALLGNKRILAHILVKTVDEFAGMEPKEVENFIEGEPIIGKVPVEPGLTNKTYERDGERVVGFYNDIKRVYSIWICMNMEECVWDHIHLTEEKILGNHPWKGGLDLFNIVLIGLPKKVPKQKEEYELHRLLTALFSIDLTVNEKIDIIENEYHIPMEYENEKEMDSMCNLGEGVYEAGIEQGRKTIIVNMFRNDMSLEQIATVAELSVDEVQQIIEENTNE